MSVIYPPVADKASRRHKHELPMSNNVEQNSVTTCASCGKWHVLRGFCDDVVSEKIYYWFPLRWWKITHRKGRRTKKAAKKAGITVIEYTEGK